MGMILGFRRLKPVNLSKNRRSQQAFLLGRCFGDFGTCQEMDRHSSVMGANVSALIRELFGTWYGYLILIHMLLA